MILKIITVLFALAGLLSLILLIAFLLPTIDWWIYECESKGFALRDRLIENKKHKQE